MKFKLSGAVAMAALLTMVSACSGPKPPTGEMATARAMVQNAQASDARQSAPVELNAAQDKLRRAEKAMENKDYALAKQLAEEADADAQLASAKARSGRATSALQEVQGSINSLRNQTGGPASGHMPAQPQHMPAQPQHMPAQPQPQGAR